MLNMRTWPIELTTALYLLSYLPYIVITRWLATVPLPGLGRPLTGLEILPATLIIATVFTYLWIWLSGWWRHSRSARIGPLAIPAPTGWMWLSGVCTAFILFTVPLSYTFAGVSIPFIQLVMRGDILIIAPLVDLFTGRRVRWWSWTALMLVAVALVITVGDRGGFHMPLLAWLTVILYTIGYFGRLAIMTKIGKTGDAGAIERYFVEEKLIAMPLAVGVLALIGALGFIDVWSSNQFVWIAALAAFLFIVSIFSIIILLDKRENSFCVPLERAASLLAGVGAAYILAIFFGGRYPTTAELIGSALLVAAIVLLSIAPRLSEARKQADAAVA
jgi:drug/metabolite transporter (DMT)-like permease